MEGDVGTVGPRKGTWVKTPRTYLRRGDGGPVKVTIYLWGRSLSSETVYDRGKG